jgi:DNA uptake protein ComE-like DNA-binding protein
LTTNPKVATLSGFFDLINLSLSTRKPMKSNTAKSIWVALALACSANFALASDAAPPAATKSTKATTKAPSQKVKLVDINNAKKAELKTLPGVSDELADKIIAGRPYLSKAHLLTHKVVPEDIYAGLRAQVIAKQKGNPSPKPTQK